MKKNRRPVQLLERPMPAHQQTLAERLAAVEAARAAEVELEQLADEIALFERWLADPGLVKMRGSLHAALDRRRDRRIHLLSQPIPVPLG